MKTIKWMNEGWRMRSEATMREVNIQLDIRKHVIKITIVLNVAKWSVWDRKPLLITYCIGKKKNVTFMQAPDWRFKDAIILSHKGRASLVTRLPRIQQSRLIVCPLIWHNNFTASKELWIWHKLLISDCVTPMILYLHRLLQQHSLLLDID